MTKHLLILLMTLVALTGNSQNKMRTVDELINKEDPGWTLVNDWVKSAKNKVEVLCVDTIKAKDALYKTQVTTRSIMGSIIYMTGGILVDDGWIRIIGSGSSRLSRNLPDWNKGKSFKEFGETPSFLLIADDAIGGFFLLNGGGLGKDLGKVYYCSPDNLKYEPLDITYTGFITFCFNGDLTKFYDGQRWTDWRKEVSNLDGDKAFSFYPFLWSEEGKDINKDSRKIVPIEELYNFNLQAAKQFGLDKNSH